MHRGDGFGQARSGCWRLMQQPFAAIVDGAVASRGHLCTRFSLGWLSFVD